MIAGDDEDRIFKIFFFNVFSKNLLTLKIRYALIPSLTNNKLQNDTTIGLYKNFYHLTDEEKQQIQENW